MWRVYCPRGRRSTLATTSSSPTFSPGSDQAADRFPAWSPDGRYIAFERADSIYLIPPLGGPERKLADFNASHVAWTPDGKSVAVSGWRKGVHLISVESGQESGKPRQI